MSTYVRKKAIRYRFTAEDLAKVENVWDYKDKIPGDQQADFCRVEKPGFEVASGIYSEYYLDWVLEDEDDACSEEFAKSRKLSEAELSKYVDKFKQIIPNADPKDFRLVEFCYYNGSDAEAVFEETKDDFYDEV